MDEQRAKQHEFVANMSKNNLARELAAAIVNYQGDDPLQPWLRYISWLKESQPEDLQPWLQACAQAFETDERYVSDIRYLRVWVQYADCCPEPADILSGLEGKIGQEHALFYEAYGTCLELRRNFTKAKQIYELGVSRQAQPIGRLKNMYESFLHRMNLRHERTQREQQQALSCMMKLGPERPNGFAHSYEDTGACQNSGFGGFIITEAGPAKTLRAQTNSNPPTLVGWTIYGMSTEKMEASFEEARLLHWKPAQSGPQWTSSCGNLADEVNDKEKPLGFLRENVGFKEKEVPPSITRWLESNDDLQDRNVVGLLRRYTQKEERAGHELPAAHFLPARSASLSENVLINHCSVNRIDKGLLLHCPSPPRGCGPVDNSVLVDGDEIAGSRPSTEQHSIDLDANAQDKMDHQCLADTTQDAVADILSMFTDPISCNASKPKAGFSLGMRSRVPVFVTRDFDSQNFEVPNFIPNLQTMDTKNESNLEKHSVYPWEEALVLKLLKDLNPPLTEYEGYLQSTKKYTGTVSLSMLKSGVRNKTLKLGSSTYHMKRCTGKGAFAQVYEAEVEDGYGRDDCRVVLKVQKPACPWEYYIYKQLDIQIPSEERCFYGYAHKIHVYSDCSFMMCDYCQYGTLQELVNAYLALGQRMDEVMCMYYTIEMLDMLEVLHRVGLIHGDLKPDNLLIRSDSDDWEEWPPDRPGRWKHQGLCLIDWGRSIDTALFPEGMEFIGDSNTVAFRCIEMLEKRPWTFQVDTYGLCGVVHCLLHGSYMEIQKSCGSDSRPIYSPKAPYKRYWNVELWQNLFQTLLNVGSCATNPSLGILRKTFENHLMSTSGLVKKLHQLLLKQGIMLRSRR